MNISILSQKELLYQVDMGVNAALSIADVGAALLEQGITPEKAKKGLDLRAEVLTWQSRQDETHRNVQKAQRALSQVRDSIDVMYGKHRTNARFFYREDEDMLKKLHLKGVKKVRYTDWLEQVQNFYEQVDVKSLEAYGILPKEVNEVKKLISQLSELIVLRNDAKRQAQQVTQAKQKAVAELRQWFRYFIKVAELACHEDPQLLESMGIVVPSR
ncbi:hypothetical protein WJR50_04960 [Catalinimonas sp. 4WD22]|uniref:hypothetical protein n=1 Tax=Catalinimonas locisalis TaxID=3133978 RepID=UPI003100BD8D